MLRHHTQLCTATIAWHTGGLDTELRIILVSNFLSRWSFLTFLASNGNKEQKVTTFTELKRDFIMIPDYSPLYDYGVAGARQGSLTVDVLWSDMICLLKILRSSRTSAEANKWKIARSQKATQMKIRNRFLVWMMSGKDLIIFNTFKLVRVKWLIIIL